MQPSPVAARWMLLAGIWLIYLVFGLITASLAPLVDHIAASLNVGNGVMGLILGAWPFAYILAALPMGALLDRIGVRRGLVIAVVVMAASAMLRGVAQGPIAFTVAVALFGLSGPLISVGAPKLITQLFTGTTRATAMGIYITGPYLGGILALSLTNGILLPLAGGNWRQVMLFHAGACLAAGLVWLGLSSSQTARAAIRPVTAMNKFNPTAFLAILGSIEVRLILIVAVGIFALNHTLNNWLPMVLVSRGLTAVEAGYWASIPTATGILGALTVPRFASPHRQIPIMAALFLAMLTATFLLHLPPGPFLAIGLVFQGIARGTMMTIAMLMLMECHDVPKDRLGLAGGLFFTTAEIGGVLGPTVFGSLSQATGGFGLPLGALGFLSLLCLLLLVPLSRRQRPVG